MGRNTEELLSLLCQEFLSDGELLVDTGNPLAAAQANTLFQKWSEWNNVSLMLATNPAHVARFNTMKAAMEAFPGEKAAFTIELVKQLKAAGFNTDQFYVLTGKAMPEIEPPAKKTRKKKS